MKIAKHLNKIIPLISLILLLTPLILIAGVVPCSGSDCNFSMLVKLVKNILDYILIITAPLSAIMFAYAGFLYLSSQGNPAKRSKANSVFVNVGIGIFFIVGAWLIAKAVLSGLETKSGYDLLSD
ncbi:MAG: pilin [Patescibacteria group bacterium]|nr:pilin [Patescibacteria group bacterium]